MSDVAAVAPDGFEALARRALAEVTPPETVGELLGTEQPGAGVTDLAFASTLPGYVGWHWTVSMAQLPDEPPSVLEVELLPGDGALLAPAWVPWAERLAEYRRSHPDEADVAEEGLDEELESDEDALDDEDVLDEEDVLDDEADDELDGVDFEAQADLEDDESAGEDEDVDTAEDEDVPEDEDALEDEADLDEADDGRVGHAAPDDERDGEEPFAGRRSGEDPQRA